MWLYKLMCVFILAKSTIYVLSCTPIGSWSSCSSDCGGGVRTRNCRNGGTQSQSCKTFCFYGYWYSGGCHCSAWRPGRCCEGCSNPGIAHCKPEMYECGGSPDGIKCTDCYLPYKSAGFNKGCVRKPCSENTGGCSHLCTGVGRLTTCTCRAGYQLSSDEYSCIDIDECGTGVSTCSQICINTNGTYHCECEEGFYLDNDSVTCIRTESTTIHSETYNNTTEVTPSITPSTYYETSVFLTKVTTRDVTTSYGSSSSVSTTQMEATLATDNAFPISNDGITEGSRRINSEKSSAVGLGVGVSVCILFLVGGALVMVVLKRRGILHCFRKTGNNEHSENEPVFKDNMTYRKSNEDNVAHHNSFILEKYGQSISNNVEHYNESNEANIDDEYNTIHDTEEPYEHVNVENSDYDHTTNVLTSEYDARKTENVYNKLKMDRPGQSGHGQRHGLSVVQDSEDDYDTTSAVVTHGKDDDSDYNLIPHTASNAGATGDAIKGDKGGDYDAINSIQFKVAQADDSDYAHVK